ncbi:MAG: hypothetical protein Q7S03_02530 [bacterium]|nr:hypothetical protein [bacterium]
MKTQRVSSQFLALAVLTFLTVFTWIGFDVYRTLKKPLELQVPKDQLSPLDPTLKTIVIDNLSKREVVDPSEYNPGTVIPSPKPATDSGRPRLP